MKNLARKIFRNKKGVEPVVATVIITGTIIALVTVAMIFANNLLTATIAQGNFNSAKQYMQTVAMQIDDVAWQIGQTETVPYSSTYGTVNALKYAVLTYSINFTANGVTRKFAPLNTTIIYFYMPVSYYSISNNYFGQVWPSQVLNPVNCGSTAPVATEFAVEKMPMLMANGSYIRVVVAPVIRLINSTVTTSATSSTFYFNLYLPALLLTSSPRLSQSVTLTTNSVSVLNASSTARASIGVAVSFPKSIYGYDNTFFHFPSISRVITAPQNYTNYVADLYTASVAVSLGANL
jgi:hypothetical protein